MNAILFLLKEHAKFKKTFIEINSDSHRYATKKTLLDQLCTELVIHETMEQERWYSRLNKNIELKKIIHHLITEEKSAAKKIKEFNNIKTQAEWQKKFLELKKDVEHHAHEEETRLFPKVEQLLTKSELETLGLSMYEFKQGYLKKAA